MYLNTQGHCWFSGNRLIDLHNHYIALLIYISICTHIQNERARGNFLCCASGGFSSDLPALVSHETASIKQQKRLLYKTRKKNKVAKILKSISTKRHWFIPIIFLYRLVEDLMNFFTLPVCSGWNISPTPHIHKATAFWGWRQKRRENEAETRKTYRENVKQSNFSKVLVPFFLFSFGFMYYFLYSNLLVADSHIIWSLTFFPFPRKAIQKYCLINRILVFWWFSISSWFHSGCKYLPNGVTALF